MPSVRRFVPRPPAVCWRHFTDAASLTAWVPGLRRAWVVATDDDGLAREVAFEYSASRTYSLVYTYDRAALTVSWAPRSGQRDAVRGAARFVADSNGTLISYDVEEGAARTPAEQAADDPIALLDSFARWLATRSA